MSSAQQPGNSPDPVWHMGPLPDPGPALSAGKTEHYAYWDSMQLAYNYDLLDPSEGSAHEAAFLRLAGRAPWEADRTTENEAGREAEAGQ